MGNRFAADLDYENIAIGNKAAMLSWGYEDAFLILFSLKKHNFIAFVFVYFCIY